MTCTSVRTVASFVLGAIVPVCAAFAQTPTPSTPASAAPAAQQAPAQQSAVNTLAGKILKKDGRYVLHESASKDDYVLEDQKIGKRYYRKVVFVTGVVDQVGKTIHQVKKVEVAA